MMDYELFKKVIAERIKEYLPPGFARDVVEINTVHKINQEKDTLIVRPVSTEDVAAMPNIYLDEMYEAFQKKQDLDMILCEIAALIVHYTARFPKDEVRLNLQSKKDSIIMNLVNTRRNEELLKNVPHREVMDLSVIYRIIMERRADGMATMLISNPLMEELGLTLEELDQIARENTARMFPPEIMKLSDFLYVMTNESKIHGASTMICQEAVDQLEKEVGSDFYLIPSSIHEVIAIPRAYGDVCDLLQLLEEGNRVCTRDYEILSNTVYQYDSSEGVFHMAGSYYVEEEWEAAGENYVG